MSNKRDVATLLDGFVPSEEQLTAIENVKRAAAIVRVARLAKIAIAERVEAEQNFNRAKQRETESLSHLTRLIDEV